MAPPLLVGEAGRGKRHTPGLTISACVRPLTRATALLFSTPRFFASPFQPKFHGNVDFIALFCFLFPFLMALQSPLPLFRQKALTN